MTAALVVIAIAFIGAGAYLDQRLPGGPAALVARRKAKRQWSALMSGPIDLAMLEAMREVDEIGRNTVPIAIPECKAWCGLGFFNPAVPQNCFRVDSLAAFCTPACLNKRRPLGRPWKGASP